MHFHKIIPDWVLLNQFPHFCCFLKFSQLSKHIVLTFWISYSYVIGVVRASQWLQQINVSNSKNQIGIYTTSKFLKQINYQTQFATNVCRVLNIIPITNMIYIKINWNPHQIWIVILLVISFGYHSPNQDDSDCLCHCFVLCWNM